MDKKTRDLLIKAQKFEVTEDKIYEQFIKITKNEKNKKVMQELADGSKKHAKYWSNITGVVVNPSRIKVFVYSLIFRVFRLTFGIKLMEKSEVDAEKLIEKIMRKFPEHRWMLEEEKVHEQKIISLINEDFLNYVGSIVLGANDAIITTFGTAAGLSIALSNVHLIGMTGLISGCTAALSMSSSSFLSSSSEKTTRRPLAAGIYTGITYILTVLVLVLPYFLVENTYVALFMTLGVSIVVVGFLTYYISIIQQISFKRRFIQNISLSTGIAVISFIIGYLVNTFFGLG